MVSKNFCWKTRWRRAGALGWIRLGYLHAHRRRWA
jgi:hypothetical protein